MSNVFKITYFNGAFDHIKLELESIEHAAGQIFGKTVAELREFGGDIELIGEYIPDKIVAEVTSTNSTVPPAPPPSGLVPPVTPEAPGLVAADGTSVPNPFAPPAANAVSTGTADAGATVVTPLLPVVEASTPETAQTAVVTPPTPVSPIVPPLAPVVPPPPVAPPPQISPEAPVVPEVVVAPPAP